MTVTYIDELGYISSLQFPEARGFIYRVFRNVVAFFVLCIYQLLRHLGSQFWTFSWSPFNSDIKYVLTLIPSIKIDQISTLRRKKQKFKTNIFLFKKRSLAYVIKS